MQIDLLKCETHDHPWKMYAWMRDEDPLYWDDTNEIWAVTRYEDIIRVARDPETFTSSEGNRPKMPGEPNFINMDGHAHLKRRSLVQDLFTPKAVGAAEGYTREIVSEIIDRVLPLGRCEFVADIASPLPLKLIATMVGDPPESHESLHKWMEVFTHGGCGPDYVTEEVQDTFIEFATHHYEVMEERQKCPAHDILSMWLRAGERGVEMDEEDMLFEHVMMLVGGAETTRNAISGGLIQLILHPEQWDAMVEDPSLIPNAVEEMCRWVSPFINMTRTVTKDTEFHGKTLKEGDELMMIYPAANRDPRVFDRPERFDIRRDFSQRKPIAFGYGRHHCLGAHLARLEMKVMFEELAKRMENIHLDGDPEWLSSSFMRGPKTLPIAFRARAH